MERRLVYDSDLAQPGRCPTCGKRRDRCTCQAPRSRGNQQPAPVASNLPKDGVVRLLRNTKGRGGKTVTLVTGVPGREAELAALLSDLKRLCGTGGTLRGDVIELQGDVRDRLQPELARRGFRVKIAGG
jgi:translation initiation factor 1